MEPNYEQNLESSKQQFYDCICDDNKAWANFGGSHTDSDVDFRQKRQVFWERSVPGDVSGAEFKCKPSYLEYTDHRTQQSDSKNEYHCFHAIGLYLPQKERKKGQTFLINLEDGKDSVVTDQKSDETPYTFWLGEKGEKSFYGGKTRNEFILNGKCSEGLLSGNLYGGPGGTDSLIVGPECAKGEVVEVINRKNHGNNKLKVYLSGKLNLDFERVENIIGRPNQPENVQVACNTRKLFLNGGASSSKPDTIKVDNLHCPLDLATVLGNYTDFSSRAMFGEITVYVGHDMEGSSINVIRPRTVGYKYPTTTIIFTEAASQSLDIQQDNLKNQESSLKIWATSDHARSPLTIKYSSEVTLKGNEQHQLFFNESSFLAPNMFSVLLIPANERSAKLNGPVYFFHNLGHNKGAIRTLVTRVGNQNLPNLFNISGRDWNVRGGQKDDTFLLNTEVTRVAIDGKDGQNTLVVQQAQKSIIDLNGNDNLKKIQTVVKGDNVGSSLVVSTGCDTKAVVTKGETGTFLDAVHIHKCPGARELQVDAGGRSSVVVDGDVVGENEIVRVVAHGIPNTLTHFKLETQNVHTSKLFVQVELGAEPQTLYFADVTKHADGKSFRAVMKGGGVESLDLNLRINDNDGFYLSTPQIQLVPTPPQVRSTQSKTGYPSQLVFERDTLDPVAVHVIQENSNFNRIVGFELLENLFQIQSSSWIIEGGGVKDTFIGGPSDLATVKLYPNENSDNTLVINYDEKNKFGKTKPFHVNLLEEKMGWKDEANEYQGRITGGYIRHVIGRSNQSDVITTSCAVRSVAGRGGVELDYPDLIVIGNCKDEENVLEVHLGKYTQVKNSAENGTFKYFVDLDEPLANNPITLTSTATNQHKIVFQDAVTHTKFTSINFEPTKHKLSFHIGSNLTEFPLYRPDEQSDYTNPKFLVNSFDITRDVRVDNEGIVVATALLDSDCVDRGDRNVKGLPLDINNFLINITGADVKCNTVIEAGENSRSNHFWLYGISSNQLTIRGLEHSEQISSLHLDQDFLGNESITSHLSPQNGYLDIPGPTDVKLMFIDKYVGRSNEISYDTVIPSCYTKQVSGVDLVDIKVGPTHDCAYDLIIGMEPGTQENFEWNGTRGAGRANLSEFWSSTFHYRFPEPMSFELGQSYPGLLDGVEHNMYLPFSLDEMETLTFEENKLYYTIDGEKYSISMVSQPGDEDQFYPQPTMITQDGLRLLAGRDASVLISGELRATNSTGQELLEKYQDLANTLGVTMLIQSDAGIFHVGNDGANLERNVVQNVAYSDSYLGGGGAASTIYEVVSLDKNVYLSTGLNDEILVPSSVNTEGPYISKQTIDLTDIVSPIRYQTVKKYKPTVNQVGDDLVITMEGHLEKYPGKIVVYDGASERVRDGLQVLLSHAFMKFSQDGGSWQLAPMPVHLERETVYSLAAEDLEYDTHVYVYDHVYGPEYHFRFDYSKHGDDLHLSDIEEFKDHRYDERHIEMTTVIITDFYKNPNVHSTQVGSNTNIIQGDAPAEIVNVILDLPGLKIKLDGDNVFLISNQNEVDYPVYFSPTVVHLPVNGSTKSNSTPPMATKTFSSPPSATNAAPVLLDAKMMTNWANILHKVEEEILEELAFVHRIY